MKNWNIISRLQISPTFLGVSLLHIIYARAGLFKTRWSGAEAGMQWWSSVHRHRQWATHVRLSNGGGHEWTGSTLERERFQYYTRYIIFSVAHSTKKSKIKCVWYEVKWNASPWACEWGDCIIEEQRHKERLVLIFFGAQFTKTPQGGWVCFVEGQNMLGKTCVGLWGRPSIRKAGC